MEENTTKEKTNNIVFEELKISSYVAKNKNHFLSKIMRSKTLNIKEYQQCLYENDLCVPSGLISENMDHFMTCLQYENDPYEDWCQINGNNTQLLNEVGLVVNKGQETGSIVEVGLAVKKGQETVEHSRNYIIAAIVIID